MVIKYQDSIFPEKSKYRGNVKYSSCWRCIFSIDNQAKTKSFSIQKYGIEAKLLAIKYLQIIYHN